MSDGGAVPHIQSAELAFPRTIDALLTPIGDGGKNFLLGEDRGDLLCSITIHSHTEDTAHHLGGLFVHDPPFGIVRVFFVAIGRRPHRFTSIALDLIADPALLADVTGVPLVEQVADGRQLILAFGGVDIVRNRHQTDVMFREKFLGQPAYLNVVAAQPGKVSLC